MKTTVIALSLLGLVFGTALAQTERQTSPEATKPLVLSDSIIGSDLQTTGGEDLGRIAQLIIHVGDGKVRYAVADISTWLGEDRQIAIPWRKVERTGPDTYVANVSAQLVRDAPVFEEDEWMDIDDYGGWEQDIWGYYGLSEAEIAEESELPGVERETAENVMETPLILSDDIIGTSVENQQGEEVGDIEQFIVNREQGNVAYAILDVGGFLGIGEREIAVPWGNLDWTAPEEIVLVGARNLGDAPEFDEDEWFEMDDYSEWEREVNDFFGRKTSRAR